MKSQLMLAIIASSLSVSTYSAECTLSIKTAKEALVQDYKNYLLSRLEDYHSLPVSFDSLHKRAETITGAESQKRWIRDIQNPAGKTFLHVAVEKEDLPFIKNAFEFFSTMHPDKESKYPLDIAIEKLVSTNKSIRNEPQIAILETIANRIAQKAYSEKDKEECLRKLISLELICKANRSHPYPFVPQKDLLYKLVPKEEDAETFLSEIYRQTHDKETGNTFAHLCVQQQDPDELYKLVLASRIATTTNKENLDPVACALAAFRKFTANPTSFDPATEGFKKARCCFFMLCRHFDKNNPDCCKQHMFI
jgi:hypothetical protein